MMSRWLLLSVGAAAPVALNAASIFAASLRGAPSLPVEVRVCVLCVCVMRGVWFALVCNVLLLVCRAAACITTEYV